MSKEFILSEETRAHLKAIADKPDAVFTPDAPIGERITPEPNRNVHPKFGRILRLWELWGGMEYEPKPPHD